MKKYPRFVDTTLCLVLVMAVVIVIIASIIAGGVGSGGSNPKVLPAGAQELSRRVYATKTVPPGNLCGGAEEVQETAPYNDGLLAVCNEPQSWATVVGPRRHYRNFGSAVGHFWSGLAGLLLAGAVGLTALWTALLYGSIGAGNYRTKRRPHARRQQTFEEKCEPLALAYSKNEIDTPTYERKLDELRAVIEAQ